MAIPLLGAITAVVSKGLGLVDQFVEDKDQANKLKAQLEGLLHTEIIKLIDAQKEVLIAEMSGNWLQRSWRPLLMLTVVAIVFNNYVLFPYLQMLFNTGVMLELPQALWELLKIGVGGYVLGRSAEKVAREGGITSLWKSKN